MPILRSTAVHGFLLLLLLSTIRGNSGAKNLRRGRKCKLPFDEAPLTPIPRADLPQDFEEFDFEGESALPSEILLSAHEYDFTKRNYMYLLSHKGEVLWFTRGRDGSIGKGKIYRNKNCQKRITYVEYTRQIPPFLDLNELVVLDFNFNEIDRVTTQRFGSFNAQQPITHDYILFDDGHYALLTFQVYDSVVEFAIQEIQDLEVVFHFQSNEYPELRELYFMQISPSEYLHPNSLDVDQQGNYLVSVKYLGLLKIDRLTKQILWVIGVNRNDFSGMSFNQTPQMQHDARILRDGVITVYDNFGSALNRSRLMMISLDERKKALSGYWEYVLPFSKHSDMGSFQVIDQERFIGDVNYGGSCNFDWMYEELDLKTGESLMRFKIRRCRPLFKVHRLAD